MKVMRKNCGTEKVRTDSRRLPQLETVRCPGLRGFTLIELLVVIAIIGILAGILLKAFGPAKTGVKKMQALQEMKMIETAIQGYHSTYSRYPTPTNLIAADFTFSSSYGSTTNGYSADNSALMAILLDEDALSNSGHVKNPQRTPFLETKRSSSANLGGLGPDLVFRDPWGKSYNITIDYDYDDLCRDNFYKDPNVSAKNDPADPDGGYNGLRSYDKANPTTYALKGPIMIWSSGPDGTAKQGVTGNPLASPKNENSDNILSWTK